MKKVMEALRSVKWENGELIILDQTKLPDATEFIKLDKAEDIWDAIFHLKVRGAPAIGIAAAYGLCVAMRDTGAKSHEEFMAELRKNSQYLASSRPTAVNLFWALKRMERAAFDNKNRTVEELKEILIREANAIRDEDEGMCRAIGENALTLFRDGMTVLTHCNAGGLATAMYGTALAPIYLAKEKGMDIKVFADETRPASGSEAYCMGAYAGRCGCNAYLRQHGRSGNGKGFDRCGDCGVRQSRSQRRYGK